ncbi:hypothetical protein C1H46_004336 [Malus baccata]|uniref:Uncharacterized protein n=1 Tax=Malus baccata TaxID=106549 RepID=A0A540NGA4_MALBA|nr:hypothetical protein C1H46_004336 [Malus baccata]
MPLLDDPIKQLAAGTELHDEVHEDGVLVGALDLDDAGVLGEVVHDLNLPPDVVVVLLAEELALGDGLAGVVGAGGLVGAEVGGAELSLAQFLAHQVMVSQPRRFVRQY